MAPCHSLTLLKNASFPSTIYKENMQTGHSKSCPHENKAWKEKMHVRLIGWLGAILTCSKCFPEKFGKVRIEIAPRSCRDGSAVRSICYCPGVTSFGSQHAHGGSQSSITPMPEEPLPSSAFNKGQALM